MMRVTESLFVSDLLWHDSFPSPFSGLELFPVLAHVNKNSPSSGTTLVGVFVISLLCPFSLTLYRLWFPHRRACCGMAPITPDSGCEICQLTLTQPCLTASQNIFIQASFTGVCLHFFCVCQAWRGLPRRDSADRWNPAGGSGVSQVLPVCCCWVLSRTWDVVFINYSLSRCSYYSSGGRRKWSFRLFCAATAYIFVFNVLTLFWTPDAIFEKWMIIDLFPSMFYL